MRVTTLYSDAGWKARETTDATSSISRQQDGQAAPLRLCAHTHTHTPACDWPLYSSGYNRPPRLTAGSFPALAPSAHPFALNVVVAVAHSPTPTHAQINLSSFALLFSEIVRYSHNRVNSIHELEEKYVAPRPPRPPALRPCPCTNPTAPLCRSTPPASRLSEVGERVGIRVLELLMLKDRNCKRETKVSGALFFVQATVWKVRAALAPRPARYFDCTALAQ